MTKSKTASGECLCGAVRFEIDLPVKWCAHCHCSLCRRAHGAGYVTWVGVASDGFRVIAGEDELFDYESSPEAIRSFCGICGSSLFFESARWPGEVHVALASLKDPIDRAPQAHVFFSDKAEWVEIHDALPKKGGKTGLETLS